MAALFEVFLILFFNQLLITSFKVSDGYQALVYRKIKPLAKLDCAQVIFQVLIGQRLHLFLVLLPLQYELSFGSFLI